MTSPLLWIGILVVAVLVLYFAGGAISKQSMTVGGCYAEWDTIARTIQSELCPNATVPCLAEPFVMQHNAIIDALLCACAKAAPDYASSELNTQIEDSYKANTNLTLTVREVCEGGQLAKWTYG
jgi:hypothetical protein